MITGKNIMSWNVPAVQDGTPEDFAQLLVDAKFEAVCLKVADGAYVHRMKSWSPWPHWGENVQMELIEALRTAKIKIYFWHFVYGYNPQGELNVARQQCEKFQPDGYIWNAESAFDRKPNAEANARLLSSGLASSHNHIHQGLLP